MADRDGLENRCTGNRTEGSNPSLSASKEPQSIAALFLFMTQRRAEVANEIRHAAAWAELVIILR